jgi:NAD(P)-dependent dehydrogenase (short-subunit alcohol dehydrogenase family)
MGAELTDRVAVVTGGGRGLGFQIAQAYAQHGADVVIASRNAEHCAEVAAKLAADTGRRVLGVGCHVGRWADCDALVETVYERFGCVDILVNNAGMSPLYPALPEITEDLFDKVIAVNLKGAFRLASLVGTRMARQRGGSIININISSIASVQPRPSEAPYAAAKAGLNTLGPALARAFSPSVRVNTIMAGPFLTDIAKSWDAEAFADRARTAIPLGRGGEPHEIVGAALYLASDASSFTTGAVLKVDGGMAWAAG